MAHCPDPPGAGGVWALEVCGSGVFSPVRFWCLVLACVCMRLCFGALAWSRSIIWLLAVWDYMSTCANQLPYYS